LRFVPPTLVGASFDAGSDVGWVLPASCSRCHCSRYAAATSASSTRSALLSWVHKPVVVQLVLPVQARFGLPLLSTTTRNLLCASAPGDTKRSLAATSAPASISCLRASLFSSRFRASAGVSVALPCVSFLTWTEPLAHTMRA